MGTFMEEGNAIFDLSPGTCGTTALQRRRLQPTRWELALIQKPPTRFFFESLVVFSGLSRLADSVRFMVVWLYCVCRFFWWTLIRISFRCKDHCLSTGHHFGSKPFFCRACKQVHVHPFREIKDSGGINLGSSFLWLLRKIQRSQQSLHVQTKDFENSNGLADL